MSANPFPLPGSPEYMAKPRYLLIREANAAFGQDPKGWANWVIARHEAGERVNSSTFRIARSVLRAIDVQEVA